MKTTSVYHKVVDPDERSVEDRIKQMSLAPGTINSYLADWR